MEMASRSIDLIGKKAHLFSELAKEQLQVCTCSPLFLSFFAVVCTTTMPFCTTKASNFLCYKLLIFMEKLSYVLIKAFVSRVLVRFYFFTATHFHLVGLAFLIRHRRYEIFMFFFQRIEIRLLCFRQLSLFLFLCYPGECRRQKYREKRHDFVVVFSL